MFPHFLEREMENTETTATEVAETTEAKLEGFIAEADLRTRVAYACYTAYCIAVGGVAFNGEPLPTWEAFLGDENKQKQVDGWYAAADAAISQLTSNNYV